MEKVQTEDKAKILSILEKYGEVKPLLNKARTENDTYLFTCDIKKVTDDKILHKVSKVALIMRMRENNKATLYLFCVFKKEQYNSDVMKIINKVNSQLGSGKFYIDEDGDVNWNSSFDIRMVNEEMIKNLLASMLQEMLALVLMVKNNEK